MFEAKGLDVALAMFFLIYLFASLLVLQTWKFFAGWIQHKSARQQANGLFALRVFPFVLAVIFTFGVTLPSFILLEPRNIRESVGIAPLILGLCCLVLIAWGIIHTVAAQRRTAQTISAWLSGASRLKSTGDDSVPIFQTGHDSPTLTVAGISAPKVLVSEAAIASLNEKELHRALRHEIAHVRSYDNFKKLTFRFLMFPGMRPLERVWHEAAEMAADDAAVSNREEALDLASALIKISRLATGKVPEFTMGLLHSSTALSKRIQRLCTWTQPHPGSSDWFYLVPTGLAGMMCTAVIYHHMLVSVHRVTEWLVR